MKALKIKVDFSTGGRPVDCRNDPNLRCHPTWQCTKSGYEIRAVLDGKTKKYKDIPGVEILSNDKQINEALDALCPPKTVYKITNELIMTASLQQKLDRGAINLDNLEQEATTQEELEFLHRNGVRGISETTKTRADLVKVFGEKL